MPQELSSGVTENSQSQELLEWIVIRLMVILDRCESPETRDELMWFVHELTDLIEGSGAR
jgi:hypothetical protein